MVGKGIKETGRRQGARENHKETTRNNCLSTEDLGQQREVQLVVTLLGVLYIYALSAQISQ